MVFKVEGRLEKLFCLVFCFRGIYGFFFFYSLISIFLFSEKVGFVICLFYLIIFLKVFFVFDYNFFGG